MPWIVQRTPDPEKHLLDKIYVASSEAIAPVVEQYSHIASHSVSFDIFMDKILDAVKQKIHDVYLEKWIYEDICFDPDADKE